MISAGEQHAQDLPGDVDPQQAEHGDHGPGDQRPYPPRPVHAQVRGGFAGGVRAECSVQSDLQERIGQQRDQRGGTPATRPMPREMKASGAGTCSRGGILAASWNVCVRRVG